MDAGARLAHKFEGCHRKGRDGRIYPYHDPVGYPTIGWGQLLSKTPWEDLSKFGSQTQEEANAWFVRDWMVRKSAVARMVKVPVPESSILAMTSFAYNVGIGALRASTLLRLVNRGELLDAAEQFDKWTRSAGRVLPGLVRRRAAEKQLFLSEVV
ncbi:COG3772 Phage-related lysozyme (muraminidase) [uncultured Caudovirales phage]|uniref:Endolysin n=1 Tax=uncultured Caudovirales phage TaxID=2100421 RepID=A0A6J5MCC1_9CAUD|nr:COG3772 Phage-related lysozyme (muraminidase) [uncultured Caudovirales phage]